jgi:ferritin
VKMSVRMLEGLNNQINAEMKSSYIYMSMAAYLDSTGLKGCANWMKIQAKEELTHAQKIYDFINNRGGRVKYFEIDAPRNDWSSPKEVFEETYKHEQKVTKMINELVDTAKQDNDHATDSMLRWFVDEQVEEESSAEEIVQKFVMVKDNPSAVFMIDKELGQRVFTIQEKTSS